MSAVEHARIYVADDEPANRRLLERILLRQGYHDVRAFSDGVELLAAVSEEEPDLILLDLQMPRRDGFAVLEALAERGGAEEYLPVLILTADAQRETRARALSSGARDFLTKPFDTLEVGLRVRNLLEARLLHKALRRNNVELRAEVKERISELRENEAAWARVTASLGRLEARDSPEATAEAICDELATLPGVALVTILARGAGGTAIPLARRGGRDRSLGVNQALSPAWSRRLAHLVAAGPWVGPWPDAAEADQGPPLPLGEAVGAVALLPLRARGGPVGILAVGTAERDGVGYLGKRLTAFEAFAALSTVVLAPEIWERQHGDELRGRISRIIRERAFTPVFQAIVQLDTGEPVGYEALTRFADGTRPDRRFADAAAAGLGPDLEVACLAAAIEAAAELPRDRFVSLNVSPALIIERRGRLAEILTHARAPVVLEITEHVPIADYVEFRASLAALGTDVRFAVDDAGAGFASFRHIVELRPDFVKLDIELVRAIERDPARQAFVAGMVYYAAKTGSTLIAEGIETELERGVLRDLAVHLGQGYLIGRPSALDLQPA